MDTIPTAAMEPQLVPVVVTNSASPVGMVRAYTLVSVAANKYSFHAKIQLNNAVIAIPGAACGIMILNMTVK